MIPITRRVRDAPMTKVKSELAGNSLPSRMFYRFGRTVTWGFCRVYNRLTITGRENLPLSGGYIIAPVHRSIIDTMACAGITKRRIRYMGKDSMWETQPGNWLLSALGAFPVSRGTADREALQRCIAVVEGGEPLVLYPEGERKSGPIVQPMFDGAAYVAIKAGVPIIPIGIGGSEHVMSKGSWFVRPKKMRLIIGAPLMPPEGLNRKAPRGVVKDLTSRLHEEVQILFDRAQAQV